MLKKELSAVSSDQMKWVLPFADQINERLDGICHAGTLLSDSGLNEEQEKQLDTIYVFCDELRLIMSKAAAQSEAPDGGKPREEAFNIYKLIRGIINPYILPANQKGVGLTVSIHPDVPYSLAGGRAALVCVLSRILQDELVNSHDCTLSLSLSLLERTKDQVHLRLCVSNSFTDLGVCCEHDEAMTAEARKMLTEDRGKIKLRRTAQGCVYTIDIPMRQAGALPADSCGQEDFLPQPFCAGVKSSSVIASENRVLLIDHEPESLKKTTKQLRILGHHPDTAAGLRQAVEMCGTVKYRVIFFRIDASESASEALKTIRSGINAQALVIGLAGAAHTDSLNDSGEDTFDGITAWPTTLVSLENTLREHGLA